MWSPLLGSPPLLPLKQNPYTPLVRRIISYILAFLPGIPNIYKQLYEFPSFFFRKIANAYPNRFFSWEYIYLSLWNLANFFFFLFSFYSVLLTIWRRAVLCICLQKFASVVVSFAYCVIDLKIKRVLKGLPLTRQQLGVNWWCRFMCFHFCASFKLRINNRKLLKKM